tara:strand:+ start:4424 stop:4804 length:381 start_codon:yes stop_codon:yes gene_type:complete
MARFTDLDLNFTRNPITGDVSVRTDAQAVIGSIKNIVNTMLGEKKFQPTFGGNVRRLLFEPVDAITTLKIEDGLKRAIVQFEPRAILISVSVLPEPDELFYEASITFRLRNEPRPVTTVIRLQRVR